jgi:hypothetical protein
MITVRRNIKSTKKLEEIDLVGNWVMYESNYKKMMTMVHKFHNMFELRKKYNREPKQKRNR